MRKTSKKRILRWVVLDLCGFCVIAYLICAQVFNFFPWKPVEIEIPDPGEASVTVQVTAAPQPTPTVAPTDTPAPTDAPATPATSAGEGETGTETPVITDTPAPTDVPTPAPTPEPNDLLKGKYADLFSTGQVIANDREYRSENIAIFLTAKTGYVCSKCGHTAEKSGACPFCGATIGSRKADTVTYTVADIYIRDLSCLKTAFVTRAEDEDKVKPLAEAHHGILAVNTDYFINYYNKHGWFIRNGVEVQRNKKISSDLGVLFADGTFETFDYKQELLNAKRETDTAALDAIFARNPQQIWYFGPQLLDKNGAPKTQFNSTLGKANPRTVVGYYEPGHYCFFVVDGRGGQRGLTFEELSLLCADMGLTAAYNMDGGASSGLYFNGKIYGQNGRSTGDIVYIAEP